MSILSVLGDAAKAEVTTFLNAFAQDDVGKLAIDAVQWAEAEVEGCGPDKKEQATTKLLNDASAIGKTLLAEGEKDANAFIEIALQAVAAGLGAAAVSAVV